VVTLMRTTCGPGRLSAGRTAAYSSHQPTSGWRPPSAPQAVRAAPRSGPAYAQTASLRFEKGLRGR